MPFPFLQLPTETRLPIYRLLLPYSEYHVEEEREDSPVRWYQGKYHCPSILFVNRQIHQEAAEILYRENFFAIYVKHPREPRLPMNESRADSESFIFVSWAESPKILKTRAWAHPQNPRIPCSTLRNHQSFHQIRKVHVSLPLFDDLAGVDMFMKKTSFTAFNGVNAWAENCARKGGYLDITERERMSIVQQLKDPIDELGKLLQTSDRIDQMHLSVQASNIQITFLEYMLEELLKVDAVGSAACYIALSMRKVWRNVDNESQLRRWEDLLQSAPRKSNKESQLPPEIDCMYRLLQAVRNDQQRNSSPMPDWLFPMPA